MDNYYHPILCRLKDISTCPAEYSLPASLAAKYERKSESESRPVVSECFVTPGTIAVREAAKCAYVSNFCLVKYKQSVYTVLSANVLTKECMFSPFIHTASWWWWLTSSSCFGTWGQETEARVNGRSKVLCNFIGALYHPYLWISFIEEK